MILESLAVGLVVVGAVLASSLDEWAGIRYALGFHYLGVVVLLGTTVGPARALVAVLVAVSVIGIFTARQERAVSAGTLVFGVVIPGPVFRPRWFDVSGAAIAIVGGVGLAVAHPLVNVLAVDVVVDVLVLTGLLYCLIGRSTGVACGLLFLVSAAGLLLQETGRAPARSELLFLVAFQLILAMALLHLQEARETNPSNAHLAVPVARAGESDPEQNVQRSEPPIEDCL